MSGNEEFTDVKMIEGNSISLSRKAGLRYLYSFTMVGGKKLIAFIASNIFRFSSRSIETFML